MWEAEMKQGPRFALAVALVVVGVVGVVGCGGDGGLEGECAADIDCRGGEICLADRCRTVCGTDATCEGDAVCDEVAGVCVEPCESDGDCAGGEVCHSDSRRCVPIGPLADGGPQSGETADAGTPDCMVGWAWCDGTCVPEGPLACGASCERCEAPAHGSTDCVSGACVTACDAGYEECATGCCDMDDPPPTGCGDGLCAGAETCATCRLDCFGSCGAPAFVSEAVDHTLPLYSFPAIGAGGGEIFVAYVTNDRQLRLAEKTAGGWATEAVPTATSVSSPDIVVDSAGRPWVAHTRGDDRNVWVSWRDGSTWRHEAPRDVESANYPSIAIDSSDTIHVAGTRSAPVRHATRTGTTWSVDDVDSEGADVGMALDDTGAAIFAYERASFLNSSCQIAWWTPASYDDYSAGDCGHRDGRNAAIAAAGSTYIAVFPSETVAEAQVRSGAGGSTEPIPTVGSVRHVNLTADPTDRIHGVIGDDTLFYVSRSPGGAWSAMLLADSTTTDGGDIAIDATGGIHIAWAEDGRFSYGEIRCPAGSFCPSRSSPPPAAATPPQTRPAPSTKSVPVARSATTSSAGRRAAPTTGARSATATSVTGCASNASSMRTAGAASSAISRPSAAKPFPAVRPTETASAASAAPRASAWPSIDEVAGDTHSSVESSSMSSWKDTSWDSIFPVLGSTPTTVSCSTSNP